MTEEALDGSGHPGIPRPLRRQGRSVLNTEISVGITTNALARICVWPRDHIGRKRVWAILRELRLPVIKVAKIKQRSGLLRFDFFVTKSKGKKSLRKLKRVGASLNWYVKRHSSFKSRRRKKLYLRLEEREVGTMEGNVNIPQEILPFPPIIESRKIKVATWNVNSISNKRQELDMYIHRSKISILGIQETWRNVQSWPLRFEGFNTFEAISQEGEGRNGLALLIDKNLAAFEIENNSPYIIIVRIRMGLEEFSIINTYIPCNGPEKKTALGHLRNCIQKEYDYNLNAHIMIMGDWNMEQMKLNRLISRWRFPLTLQLCTGNPATFRRGNKMSSLDHFVVSNNISSSVVNCKVNRSWDISDHWPLQLSVKTEKVEGSNDYQGYTPNMRIDNLLLLEKGNIIKDDNIWSVLAESLDSNTGSDMEIDVATELQDSLRSIGETNGILREQRPVRKHKYRLSKRARRAVNWRRKCYKFWIESGDFMRQSVHWTNYQNARQDAKKAIKESSHKSWLKFIEYGSKKLVDNDMAGFWSWVKLITGRGKSGPADFGPLKHVNAGVNLLAYSPLEKLDIWKNHYQSLFGDITGNSRTYAYWTEVLPGAPTEITSNMNEDFTWMELNHVLHRMKSGKAPGCDGIPPEFFKLARNEREATGPTSTLGTLLLSLANYIWRSNRIPGMWNEAHIVSIYKKGDPQNVDNYRGISLIPVGLKMVTSIVNNRLRDHLEDRNWFIHEQAGFRHREECAGHICSLVEILRRREIRGDNTYVAFIDIKKAYDTVPIGAMIRKLVLLGVHGRMLRFFSALYEDPKIRVRTKEGLSELVDQHRGLRQGCNASPLLFDIFINDILDDCRQHGISITGLADDQKEVGLLFADDLVILADSASKLSQVLTIVQAWGTKYEMKFGVPKCGIMGFGSDAMENIRDNANLWVLDGQSIPVVMEYVYLGVPIRSPVNLDVIVSDRASKGSRCFQSIRPVLGCNSIPIGIRIRLLKALLIPVLTYSAELWGCCETRVKPCQDILSGAIRSLVKIRPKANVTSFATLSLEFKIPSIHAIASAARIRAFLKFPSLRTTISKLFNAPVSSRKRTWIKESSRWLKSQRHQGLSEDTSHQIIPGIIQQIIGDKEARRRIGAIRYLENKYQDSTAYIAKASNFSKYAKGIHYLTRFRVGAVWTASRLASIGWLPMEYIARCPFCNSDVPETLTHILMECEAWSSHRVSLRDILGNGPIFLLGGRRVGIETDQSLISERWLDSAVPSDGPVSLQSTVESRLPGFIIVADFLQQICPIRFRILANLLQIPRADAANNGMAVPSGDDPVDIQWDDTIS